jgi:hypothetical protein
VEGLARETSRTKDWSTKMKKYRHFGKKWTLEYDGYGKLACITDAHSAATVVAWISSNGLDICCNDVQLWKNVPPYIKKIVSRHLKSEYKHDTGS